jgi:hypothetical protein
MKKKRMLSLDAVILRPLLEAREDSGLSLSHLVECAIQHALKTGFLAPLPRLAADGSIVLSPPPP